MPTTDELERELRQLRELVTVIDARTTRSRIAAFNSSGVALDEFIGLKASTNVTFTRDPQTGLLLISSAGGGSNHTLLDGTVHTDTLADTVTDGDMITGNATPKWASVPISVPAANVRNVWGVDNGELRGSWKAALDATAPSSSAPGDAAAAGTALPFAHRDHVHGRESYATLAAALYSVHNYVNVPDVAPQTTITAGDQQGMIHHSGPSAETAVKLQVDAETAPGASGLPVTWQYGDTDDLDTVASWTEIATYTLSSEKSNGTTSMTNASIPANRLVRTNWGTIVGTPKDGNTTLKVKRPLST